MILENTSKKTNFVRSKNKTDFFKELFDTRMWIVFLEMKVAKEIIKVNTKEENKEKNLIANTRDIATIETFDNYILNYNYTHKNSFK